MYQRLQKTVSMQSDLDPLYSGDAYHRGKRLRSSLAVIFAVVVCITLVVALIVVAIMFSGGKNISAPPHHSHLNHPNVANTSTTCGDVLGLLQGNVYEFRGIPYAEPPQRWQPPKPMSDPKTCWGGVRDATHFAPSCYQYNEEVDQYEGSEDCLYLNVWTPQIDPAAMLDVLVYIHGGDLMTGSGSEPGSSPKPELASNYNKVFVSLNYRLNAFGFMTLDVLSQRSDQGASGNYGLMDQMLALHWVQDNIHWFGGDKHKVTVFGDGSGATSILALLSLEESKGLFQRAWLISPSPRIDTTAQQAAQQNAGFINNTGCSSGNPQQTYECLMALTPEAVIQGLPWKQWMNKHYRDLPEEGEKSVALLTVDGSFLNKSPVDAFDSGTFNDVPVLVGSAAQEVDDVPFPRDLGAWNFTTYSQYIHKKLAPFSSDKDSVASGALALYGQHYTPEYQLTSMVSDIRAICPLNDLLMTLASDFEAPVYRYMVERYPSQKVESENGAMYAFHNVDLYAFFDTLSNFAETTSDADMKFKEVVKNAALEFERKGTLASWQLYPTSVALLSETKDFVSQTSTDKCDFWRAKDFLGKFARMN